MRQVYNRRQFPAYFHGDHPLALEVTPRCGGYPEYLYLPASEKQIERALIRADVSSLENARLSVEMDDLPPGISARLHLERESLDDLNAMCLAVRMLEPKQWEMLDAVVCAVQPEWAGEVKRLAEELDQFDFVPDVHTPEEYGRYMIQESERFAYDSELNAFYNYAQYGRERIQAEGGSFTPQGYVAYQGMIPLEQLMRKDPAEQYQKEQGMQLL